MFITGDLEEVKPGLPGRCGLCCTAAAHWSATAIDVLRSVASTRRRRVPMTNGCQTICSLISLQTNLVRNYSSSNNSNMSSLGSYHFHVKCGLSLHSPSAAIVGPTAVSSFVVGQWARVSSSSCRLTDPPAVRLKSRTSPSRDG